MTATRGRSMQRPPRRNAQGRGRVRDIAALQRRITVGLQLIEASPLNALSEPQLRTPLSIPPPALHEEPLRARKFGRVANEFLRVYPEAPPRDIPDRLLRLVGGTVADAHTMALVLGHPSFQDDVATFERGLLAAIEHIVLHEVPKAVRSKIQGMRDRYAAPIALKDLQDACIDLLAVAKANPQPGPPRGPVLALAAPSSATEPRSAQEGELLRVAAARGIALEIAQRCLAEGRSPLDITLALLGQWHPVLTLLASNVAMLTELARAPDHNRARMVLEAALAKADHELAVVDRNFREDRDWIRHAPWAVELVRREYGPDGTPLEALCRSIISLSQPYTITNFLEDVGIAFAVVGLLLLVLPVLPASAGLGLAGVALVVGAASTATDVLSSLARIAESVEDDRALRLYAHFHLSDAFGAPPPGSVASLLFAEILSLIVPELIGKGWDISRKAMAAVAKGLAGTPTVRGARAAGEQAQASGPRAQGVESSVPEVPRTSPTGGNKEVADKFAREATPFAPESAGATPEYPHKGGWSPRPFRDAPEGVESEYRVAATADTPESVGTSVLADIKQNEAYLIARFRGEVVLRKPGRVNAPGPDMISAVRTNGGWEIVMTDVKTTQYRLKKAREEVEADWWKYLARARETLSLPDPDMQRAILEAIDKGPVSLRQIDADFRPEVPGETRGFSVWERRVRLR